MKKEQQVFTLELPENKWWLYIFFAVLGAVSAFALWNVFAPEAKRAAYEGIFGPGGVFGLALFKPAILKKRSCRRKGMGTWLIVAIIMVGLAIVVTLLVMEGFIGESGRASSSLQDMFTDLIGSKIS
jgi:hypothetical protein